MNVLLIDDEPNFNELVKRHLRKLNATVDQQTNCEMGIARLEVIKYDIILMDHKLIMETGLECLKEVRKHYPDLPVIMLTGHMSDELISAWLEAGADDFIDKNLADMLLSHVVWSVTRRRLAKLQSLARAEALKKDLDKITQGNI